jgi:hypothetical protein
MRSHIAARKVVGATYERAVDRIRLTRFARFRSGRFSPTQLRINGENGTAMPRANAFGLHPSFSALKSKETLFATFEREHSGVAIAFESPTGC